MNENTVALEISVEQAAEMIASADHGVKLVDVRELDEYHIAHIEGFKLIPLQTLPDHLDSFTSKDQVIYVLCHHGMRSLHATHFLRQKGYLKTQSIAGGIDAWSLRIDESVPRY
jgi:rhodanese-related sulfurtransferase